MKNDNVEATTNKLRWSEIYKENNKRKYLDIKGIKKEGVVAESNPVETIKKKPYLFIIIAIAMLAIVFITCRNDIKVALCIIAFLAFASIFFFVFSYYKLSCEQDGLHVKFGIQESVIKYENLKSVYISRLNDTSYVNSLKSYNIAIRYVDSINRLRELFFDTNFLSKGQAVEFLENFIVEEERNEQYVNFERFKLLKRVAKIALLIIIVLAVIAVGYSK